MVALVAESHKYMSGNREAEKMKRAIFPSKDATETFMSKDWDCDRNLSLWCWCALALSSA